MDYILLGKERFPLEQGRYGFLPISIDKFLETNNQNCYISDIQRLTDMCILRKGIERSDNQSFIALLADIYADQEGNVLTIKQMKTHIIQSITIGFICHISKWISCGYIW